MRAFVCACACVRLWFPQEFERAHVLASCMGQELYCLRLRQALTIFECTYAKICIYIFNSFVVTNFVTHASMHARVYYATYSNRTCSVRHTHTRTLRQYFMFSKVIIVVGIQMQSTCDALRLCKLPNRALLFALLANARRALKKSIKLMPAHKPTARMHARTQTRAHKLHIVCPPMFARAAKLR